MNSTATEADHLQKARDICKNTHCLIEITAKSLRKLREQSLSNNDFIQNEILENEVRCDSMRLVTSSKL